MIRRIRTAEDLAWLLDHSDAFQGGQLLELHVHKQRLFDESSSREIVAGTVLTAVIRYERSVSEHGDLVPVTRVAKLTMRGVTDFSIFEQEGADCSEIGVIQAEAAGKRLRFWFDPHGELYVICDEAELEEVSRPSAARPVRLGMTEWTFQVPTGKLPAVRWFLDHLDQAGLPCAWRSMKRSASAHPALKWEGYLVPASEDGSSPRAGGIHVQAYGPLDGCAFGITLRTADPRQDGTGHLLMALADIIANSFTGTCLAGNHVMERDEWLGDRRRVPELDE